MKLRLRQLLTSLLILPLALGLMSIVESQKAGALTVTGSDWRAGRIIDDSIFFNKNAMTVNQIQAFLDAKVPVCAKNHSDYSPTYPGPYTCLKDYQENTTTGESNIGRYNGDGTPYQVPGGKSSAQIIWDAAQAHGINPQALIVMLQKEQSLVTDDWPLILQYQRAMGQSCPDTAPCDPDYAGFYNQVNGAAWQLRHYINHPEWFNYRSGVTRFILYNPNTSCGGSNVFIENDATAALYNYTPYQPNAGSLSNLYGTASCGAYGNRNFWRLFNSWFGSTTAEKIITVVYDGNTDNTGEMATIGFKLSARPSGNVTIPLTINKPEVARIMGGQTQIVITPDNWNNPKLNKVLIAGLNSASQNGTVYYKLDLQKPSSSDPSYSKLSPDEYSDVFLVHQDTVNAPNVYRMYDGTTRSIYTANLVEKEYLESNGWQDLGVAFSYCSAGENTIIRLRKGDERLLIADNNSLYQLLLDDGFGLENINFASSDQGTVPIYWFHGIYNDDNIYKTDSDPIVNYKNLGIAFYACEPSVKPVYRLYDRGTRSYFFTASVQERKTAIATGAFSKYEGVGFYSCATGESLYRLYRPATNSYVFVTSTSDRDYLVTNNKFVDQGVQVKLCPDGTHDVYSLYDRSIGVHFYTTSSHERDDFVNSVGYEWLNTPFIAK